MRRALVCEVNLDLSELVDIFLTRYCEMEVTAVQSNVALLRHLELESYDLVILGEGVPSQISKVISKVRETEPHVPILLFGHLIPSRMISDDASRIYELPHPRFDQLVSIVSSIPFTSPTPEVRLFETK